MSSKVKFSGKKQAYKNGATRNDSTGKGRYDLISSHMLKELALVYEEGAKNHGDNNWMGGIPFSRLYDSAIRHIQQAKMGQVDERHLGQAIWNLACIIHFMKEDREDELNDIPPHLP